MANLAEAIQGLVQHMRTEQQSSVTGSKPRPSAMPRSPKLLESLCAESTTSRSHERLDEAAAIRGIDYWPGFVDALSTLMLADHLPADRLRAGAVLPRPSRSADKDAALSRLNRQIARAHRAPGAGEGRPPRRWRTVGQLGRRLRRAEAERDACRGFSIQQGHGRDRRRPGQVNEFDRHSTSQKQLTPASAPAQVEILNQQIAALRRQLAALEDALEASGKRDRESQARIADLGSRLNVALAQKVQELARYRSDFFGRLREILGNRPEMRVVGDRFVFESEVLFDTGKAEMNPAGRLELDKLASALSDLEKEIPPEISWVMRVDGHTDMRPLAGPRSNWELSSDRAIAVVKYLVTKGVAPQRLVAAGFGEFQPIDPGDSEEALRRNRRIELKLTER